MKRFLTGLAVTAMLALAGATPAMAQSSTSATAATGCTHSVSYSVHANTATGVAKISIVSKNDSCSEAFRAVAGCTSPGGGSLAIIGNAARPGHGSTAHCDISPFFQIEFGAFQWQNKNGSWSIAPVCWVPGAPNPGTCTGRTG